MSGIELDGRVAIVTGAGGGLGRRHSLTLAERGARIVVNDLGGDRDGSGTDRAPADRVVEEIRDAGGQAVANHDGVHTWEGGEAVVATALEAFGSVDVVVNNAGILRDASFGKITGEDVDAVIDVHLRGAFSVTRAAWNHMREQGHGRVICTTSGSGLYGNFGQSNYGAAKMGLVGLVRTLAIEGARYGITAHAIAPLASSRMTDDVFPPALLERLDPAHVSGLVTYLASDSCQDTGRIYSVGGGYVARVAVVESAGVTFEDPPTADDIAGAWEAINELGERPDELTSVLDQAERISRALGDASG